MEITINVQKLESSELEKCLRQTKLIPDGFECSGLLLQLRPSLSPVNGPLGDTTQPSEKDTPAPTRSQFVHNLITGRESRLDQLLEKLQTETGSLVNP
jgi:hypothetical protein